MSVLQDKTGLFASLPRTQIMLACYREISKLHLDDLEESEYEEKARAIIKAANEAMKINFPGHKARGSRTLESISWKARINEIQD